jgi:aminoglycoside phosphotransferase (APT) family kinase protein
MAAGLSRAGVHRVEADGRVFALKISGEALPLDAWRRRLHVQQLAANEGLAPSIVHVDEDRRAVVSGFVTDHSFPAFYGNPHTRDTAIAQLGSTLRRVHDLPLPPDAQTPDPTDHLARLWAGLAGFALPDFAADALRRVLAEKSPASDRATVLSHNDVNPSNLLYDGARILLVDWETAGPNDPLYDLATISVFARMDAGECLRLLAAHDDAPADRLPTRLVYDRRLVAATAGAMFMTLARRNDHRGATKSETLESTPTLGEFYQRMRAGSVSIAAADGQWSFGLALAKESMAI